MLTKLPKWILAGAALLAFVAGQVNVIGLLGFQHQAITHLTGNTSLLASAIATGHLQHVSEYLGLICAFLIGAAVSGVIIGDATLRLGRRYGVALSLVSALLFAATMLLLRQQVAGMWLAAAACGLQNAMVSTYSGMVVRTTHVSGMFTDLGIAIGHALRGVPADSRRLKWCVVVIAGFFAGGFVGALVFERVGVAALYGPAALTASIALAYAIYRLRKT